MLTEGTHRDKNLMTNLVQLTFLRWCSSTSTGNLLNKYSEDCKKGWNWDVGVAFQETQIFSQEFDDLNMRALILAFYNFHHIPAFHHHFCSSSLMEYSTPVSKVTSLCPVLPLSMLSFTLFLLLGASSLPLWPINTMFSSWPISGLYHD